MHNDLCVLQTGSFGQRAGFCYGEGPLNRKRTIDMDHGRSCEQAAANPGKAIAKSSTS